MCRKFYVCIVCIIPTVEPRHVIVPTCRERHNAGERERRDAYLSNIYRSRSFHSSFASSSRRISVDGRANEFFVLAIATVTFVLARKPRSLHRQRTRSAMRVRTFAIRGLHAFVARGDKREKGREKEMEIKFSVAARRLSRR